MTRKEYDEYLYNISDELGETAKEFSDRTVSIIAKRLKMIGETGGEGLRSVGEYLASDLRDINAVERATLEKVAKQTAQTVKKAASANDDVVVEFYKYRGIEQIAAIESVNALPIIKATNSGLQKEIASLFKSKAFVMDGKPKPIRQVYTEVVNKAIYDVKSGAIDYNTAIRSSVKKIAESGVRTVDYESGYTRRMDSSVRMNTLDAVRQMNIDIREKQGKEFGADGVEISSHLNCAPDHQEIDGQQFTNKEWERINARLERPLGTLNCTHSLFEIIVGISKPTYSEEELKERHTNANEVKTYTVNGKTYETTGYKATQVQRVYETQLRALKDQRNALEAAGDATGSREMQKRILAKGKEYRDVSAQLGLKPKPNRTR